MQTNILEIVRCEKRNLARLALLLSVYLLLTSSWLVNGVLERFTYLALVLVLDLVAMGLYAWISVLLVRVCVGRTLGALAWRGWAWLTGLSAGGALLMGLLWSLLRPEVGASAAEIGMVASWFVLLKAFVLVALNAVVYGGLICAAVEGTGLCRGVRRICTRHIGKLIVVTVVFNLLKAVGLSFGGASDSGGFWGWLVFALHILWTVSLTASAVWALSAWLTPKQESC